MGRGSSTSPWTARERGPTPRRWSSHERQALSPLRLDGRDTVEQLSGVWGRPVHVDAAGGASPCSRPVPNPGASGPGRRAFGGSLFAAIERRRHAVSIRRMDNLRSPRRPCGRRVPLHQLAHTGRHAGDAERCGVGPGRDAHLRGAGSAGVGAMDVGSADRSGRSRASRRPADEPRRCIQRQPRLGRGDVERRASAGRQHPALPDAGRPPDPRRCGRSGDVVLRRPGRDVDRAGRDVHLRGGRARDDRLDRVRRQRLYRAVHRRPCVGEPVNARRLPDHACSTTGRGPDLWVATGWLAALSPLPVTERARPVRREASAAAGRRVPHLVRGRWRCLRAGPLSWRSRCLPDHDGPGGRSAGARTRRPDVRGHDRGDGHGRRRPDPLAGRRALVRPGGRAAPAHVAAGRASSRRSAAVERVVAPSLGVGVVKVAVVGAGRVGTAVAVLLTRAGHQVAAVSGRGATTERAARWLPGVPVLPLGETAALGDLVLLGVPDDVLGPVVAELAKAGTIHAGCWVTHLSGATGLGVLLPLRELGGRRLAAHPLQTFPDVEGAIRTLPGCRIAVTADDEEGFALGEWLATELGATPFRLRDDLRPLYHAAAVFASNYLVATTAVAERLFAVAGVPDPGDAMRPLQVATLDNVERLGTWGALTGPAARGDVTTIARNLEALAEHAPDTVSAYIAMCRVTLDLAVTAGRLSEADRAAVATVLDRWVGVR
ncbi:MAG: DUF2520 domain-containing protein [Actinobacteria bacterium]|nr:MAG: DUF2520 domain-containing protein [Actinomycetota bacterium]